MEVAELKQQLEFIKAATDAAWKEYTAKEAEEKARSKAAVQPVEEKWNNLHRVQSALETLVKHYSPTTSENQPQS